MCGIYGNIARRPGLNKEEAMLRAARLSHRGPDACGSWVSADGRAALAHRRLAIIDLSPSGAQPMTTADGRLVIVFNGEIYNYRELSQELASLGWAFQGESDTEVLLAAFSVWGESCLEHLNGMFAFAIVECRRGGVPTKVFLARDRAGKKPLYYRLADDCFEFASELKALGGGSTIDTRALNSYLARGYVPADECLASGIAKLSPAYAAVLDLTTWRWHQWRYWSLPEQSSGGPADEQAFAEMVERLIEDSVRLRLRADVPVGVLLSGGVDSSLLTAIAARNSSRTIDTFTISFPGSALDEAPHARMIARHFATNHHEIRVDAPALSVLGRMAPLIDEPLADSSIIPMYLVCESVRKDVKVVLGGDGGDELFGGYSNYTNALACQRTLGWIPFSVFAMAASALPAGLKGRGKLTSLSRGPLFQMAWGTPYFDVALRRRILTPGTLAEIEDLAFPERSLELMLLEGRDPVDRMTRTDFKSILPGDFLVKVDRSSMAHGLEVRCPYLDKNLVEFAFARIPSEMKVNRSGRRYIQRLIAKRILPKAMDVERKQGFSAPMDTWLRETKCRAVTDRMAALPLAIDRNEVQRLVEGELQGRANGARLFALLMLSIASENQGWSGR